MEYSNGNTFIINNTGGFMLVGMVVGILLVLSLTAMTLNQSSFMGTRVSANHVTAIQKDFGRQAAMAYALWQLKADPDWRTASDGEDFDFAGVTYTLKVVTSPLAGYEDVALISAVPAGGTHVRHLGVRIEPPPIFSAVYFCDTENACVRKIDTDTGIITTVAGQGDTLPGYGGDGGPAVEALLDSPMGVAGDLAGNIYIADEGHNCIRQVDPDGIITTIAGSCGAVGGGSGDNGPAVDALLNSPRALDIDGSGNVFIADRGNSCIRRIDAATGKITTVAGQNGGGDYSGDGGLATLAEIDRPEGVTVDSMGNLFISDTKNECIRKVAWDTQIITTLKSGFGDNLTIMADVNDNLFVVDNAEDAVLKIDAGTTTMTVVAGVYGSHGYNGDDIPATSARLNSPEGAQGMANGDIYIADANNDRIRKVDGATGEMTTIAGDGDAGFSGDGGLAVDARVNGPAGVHYAPGSASGDAVLTLVNEIY